MDKRYFTLFFLLLFVGFAAVSQDLKITRIEASRLSKALIDRVTDPISGEECAVLHIKTEGLTPEEENQLDFELDQASTIAKTLKDDGEILMYVPPRTVLLVVRSPFGNYRARFRDFGFKDGTVELKDYDVYIEYKRPEPISEPKADVGGLSINSTPDNCDVYLDGKKIGTSPDVFSNVSIGTHSIKLRKEGYENATMQVVVEKNKIAQVTVRLKNKTFTVNGVSFEMVFVEGGTFTMGATSEQGDDAYGDENPTHSVTLSDYCIGKFEVTQKLWEAVMGSNPSYPKGSNLPVQHVRWKDCQKFIKKLNKLCAEQLNGKKFSLPTEAQWEYAARGGNKSRGYKYSGSDSISDVAWYWANSGDRMLSGERDYDNKMKNNNCDPHPVGMKLPNELGIYDMSGNVGEWCQDWYWSYSSGSQTNPQGPSSGSNRVLRGGNFFYDARLCRVSYRSAASPNYRYNFYPGFRLAVTLVSAQAQLTLSCGDASAELYLNGKKIGTGSWDGSLAAGMYVVEARKAGHSTVKQSLTLAKQEQRSLTLDAPEPIYGKLNINSTPDSCDVYLDGKKIGTSPDIFSNVLIGTHSIELRKAGYASAPEQVTIKKNKIVQATVTLTKCLTFTVNGASFEMIAVKGGSFTMGATSEQGSDAYDSEKPTHRVTLGDYYIGQFEVTQELWEAVMGSNPSKFKGSNLPVENVSWYDAVEFCNRLSEKTGRSPYYSIDRSSEDPNNTAKYDFFKWIVRVNSGANGFRLPTEAEWEYAARGGNKSRGYKYSGSNGIGEVAWYTSTTNDSGTKPIGTKSPNELGIYDMSGNVYEWCQDWYGSYSRGSQTNPQGPSSGSARVYCGGSWFNRAWFCRVSYRSYYAPSSRNDYLGFRVVLIP